MQLEWACATLKLVVKPASHQPQVPRSEEAGLSAGRCSVAPLTVTLAVEALQVSMWDDGRRRLLGPAPQADPQGWQGQQPPGQSQAQPSPRAEMFCLHLRELGLHVSKQRRPGEQAGDADSVLRCTLVIPAASALHNGKAIGQWPGCRLLTSATCRPQASPLLQAQRVEAPALPWEYRSRQRGCSWTLSSQAAATPCSCSLCRRRALGRHRKPGHQSASIWRCVGICRTLIFFLASLQSTLTCNGAWPQPPALPAGLSRIRL